MEELAQAAKAAYENFSEKEKKQINEAFQSLDTNGDGKISLEEFMKHYQEYENDPKEKRKIFSLIDQNGDGNLQFREFLTLCHIISSGRRICDGCNELIKGLFFTCTYCRLNLNDTGNTYDLCIPCYHGRDFQHEHTEFLDNYTFLEMLSSGQLRGNDKVLLLFNEIFISNYKRKSELYMFGKH